MPRPREPRKQAKPETASQSDKELFLAALGKIGELRAELEAVAVEYSVVMRDAFMIPGIPIAAVLKARALARRLGV